MSNQTKRKRSDAGSTGTAAQKDKIEGKYCIIPKIEVKVSMTLKRQLL